MNIKRAFTFLRSLKKNNNREWFMDHKPEYQEIVADFQELIEDLLRELSAVDAGLADIEAKDCVFRIYRDVRFSKDKSPYKTHLSAYLSPGGKALPVSGYYIHLEPGGNSMAAGGLYQPTGPQLVSIREAIAKDHKPLERILSNRTFKDVCGSLDRIALKRPPKGFDPDHPAIELLKLKSFHVARKISDKELLDGDEFLLFEETFRAMWPLCEYFRRFEG